MSDKYKGVKAKKKVKKPTKVQINRVAKNSDGMPIKVQSKRVKKKK